MNQTQAVKHPLNSPGTAVINTGYQPRPLQRYIHSQLKRFNVLVCHRGFGKTILVINEIIDKALRCDWVDPVYAYIAPTFTQAERISWDILKRYAKDIPGATFNETKLICTIPRPHRNDKIKIMLLGAENPDALRGMHLNGVVLDEFAQQNPIIWDEIVRATLTNKKGWAIFIGTPKGQNNFYDMYQRALKNASGEWYTAVFKASQSKVISPEELASIKDETDADKFEQEYECSFEAALTGAYWGKHLAQAAADKRIVRIPHDPALTVDTFWDLGINDTMTIWFVQQFRLEIRIIDYFEASGEGLEYYARKLQAGHRSEYNYREHHWPHDGNSRELSSGEERSTTMRKLLPKGNRLTVHPRYDVNDSIQAVRRMLHRCYFDQKLTYDGVEGLKNYQKQWDAKHKRWQDHPLHDWASHPADSFRLLGMVLRPGDDRKQKNLPRSSETSYDVYAVGRGE